MKIENLHINRVKELLVILPYMIANSKDCFCIGGLNYIFKFGYEHSAKAFDVLKKYDVVTFDRLELSTKNRMMKLYRVNVDAAEYLLNHLNNSPDVNTADNHNTNDNANDNANVVSQTTQECNPTIQQIYSALADHTVMLEKLYGKIDELEKMQVELLDKLIGFK